MTQDMKAKTADTDPGEAGPGMVDGTQAIARAMAIVRTVARYGDEGGTLGMISEAMRLPQSTAHRILKRLVDERLLRVEKRRYVIDSLAFEISLCVLSSYQFSARFSDLVGAVARRTGHCTYLMVRSGGDAVCLQTADGTARLRVTPVDVGQRRPLGIGAGAAALLSAFDRPAIERYLERAERELRPFEHASAQDILKAALAAREKGYAVSVGMVFPDTVGIGVLIPEGPDPYMAISVAMPASAVGPGGIEDIAASIKDEISRALARIEGGRPAAFE